MLKASSVSILGLLTVQPMSGYELKKAVDISLSFFWAESFGQLYPQLRKLCEEGLIEKIIQAPAIERDKKTYQITQAGRDSLREWILQNPTSRPPRDELLMKVFFTTEGDPEAVKNHCRQARDEAVTLLRRYEEIDLGLRHVAVGDGKEKYWRMTLKLGISQTKNFIIWCDEVLDDFTT